ncbi:hypothetical protein JoomaDRAFT_2097 [Galbibacter orientalis DSM 19592]|uniref:Uncharacterized protein n=1 Tax=Galbibacter orientalis DSM 19592 TaxID=926559 RepID=I3C648_9FLAO|nr:hypothetical protein JoomaDRAFT_2097 [Galbibacter orientalis DSM 19592]
MNFIYRLLLTFNATSLIIVVYLVKVEVLLNNLNCYLFGLPNYVSYVLYFLIPIFLTFISLLIAKFLSKDNISLGTIKSIEQANNAFLPSYLGYFFVALSVPYVDTLIFVFAILFVFTFLSQTLYFNPLFLIFKYHFYYLTTTNEIKIFIITRRILKDPKNTEFEQLRRINDFTFIDLTK